MKKKKNLRKEPIYIDNDKTKKEREAQKKIVNIAKEYKEKNKETEIKIKYGRLKVGEKWYRWNERKNNLEAFLYKEKNGSPMEVFEN